MFKILLTAASAIAIIGAGTVYAQNNRTANQDQIPRVTEDQMQEGWQSTRDTVSDAAQSAENAVRETYRSIKSTFNESDTTLKTVTINPRMTANGMIGKPVYNTNGDRVAVVQDIILNSEGDATMVILGEGDFLGLGKKVAFDYNIITRRTVEGDMMASLTEEVLDNALPFSYDREDTDGNYRVIPANNYSVEELLDSDVVNPQGVTVAEADNISFRNGRADQLIVSFNEILGMGGEKAALAYNEVELAQRDDDLRFQLNRDQARQLEIIKVQGDRHSQR